MAKRTIKTPVGSYLYNKDFWHDHVDTSKGQDSCWEWTASKNNIGYGFTGFINATTGKKGMMTTHRLAYMIEHDSDIPEGMNVHHSCYNRVCCNPKHLTLGTHREKLIQMYKDNRMPPTRAPGGGRPKKNKDTNAK